jgi:hypothetical protein
MDISWITKLVWNNKEMYQEPGSTGNLSFALQAVLLAEVTHKIKLCAPRLLTDMLFQPESFTVAIQSV